MGWHKLPGTSARKCTKYHAASRSCCPSIGLKLYEGDAGTSTSCTGGMAVTRADHAVISICGVQRFFFCHDQCDQWSFVSRHVSFEAVILNGMTKIGTCWHLHWILRIRRE